MLTEEQIKAAAINAYPVRGTYYPIAMSGFKAGAQWANEQNAAEIAELRDVLRELMKAEYRLPAMYSSVIERAKKMLKEPG